MEMLLKNLQPIKYLKIKTDKSGKIIKRQNGNVFTQFAINEKFLLDIEVEKETAESFEKNEYYILTVNVTKNFVTEKNYGQFEAKMAGLKFTLVAFEKVEENENEAQIIWQTTQEITTDSSFLKNAQGKEIGALTWRRVAIKGAPLSFFCFYNLKKEALNKNEKMTFKITFANMCYDLCFCPQVKTKDTTAKTDDGVKKTITFGQKKTKKDNVSDNDKDEMIRLLKEQNALLMQLLTKHNNDVEDNVKNDCQTTNNDNDNDSSSNDSSDMTDKTNDVTSDETIDDNDNDYYLLFNDAAYREKYGINDKTNDLTDDDNDPHDDELPFN